MSTGKKAIKGTIWVALNSYASLLIVFVTGIILARILNPGDFGVYYLSLFFVDLFSRLRELGLDKALIHRQEDLPKAFRVHFTLQVSLAVLSFVVALIFSPLIAKHYSADVSVFILVVSTAYIFQAIGSTQRVYLEKNLWFGKTALVDLLALVLSSSFSIYLASQGLGPLSLVIGYASNFVLATVFFWALRPWSVNLGQLLLFDRAEIKWFLKFGAFLFVGGLATFTLYRYNVFILGTFLSATSLGFYSKAFNYAQIPTSIITSVISKVALPTYSALQMDREKLSGAFNIVLKSIIRLSFPVSLVLYLVADDFTAFILGPKWAPMVPIFRVLLIYGVLRSIFDDLGELFTAVGKPKFISFYLLIQALVGLVLAPLLVNFYQALGAAFSLSIVLALGVALAYFFLLRVVRMSSLSLFVPTAVICLLTLVSYKLIVFKLNLDSLELVFSLLSKAVIFGVIYLTFMTIIDGRSFLKDLRFILAHLRIEEPEVEELAEEEESIRKEF